MPTPSQQSPLALPPSVRRDKGSGGLERLTVAGRLADAQVYLQGAHIVSWQPKEQAPVLWVSRESAYASGKAIRGGVPVCFPWFAAHATDASAPMHGFARIRDWSLIDAHEDADGTVRLAFRLAADDRTRASAWPHPFEATYRMTIGRTLALDLEVLNPGREPIVFEEALHTYFAVQDIREVSIAGLEHTEYLDKVAAMARRKEGADPIRFSGETDRIYLDTRATCTIHDPGRRRRIHVHKRGSATTVVWNPWMARAKAIADFGDLEWPEMVCVETCNVNVHAVKLDPGARHTLGTTLEVAGI